MTEFGQVFGLQLGASGSFSAGSPTGTASGVGVMMGLGSTCFLTPVTTGRLSIFFNGYGINSTAPDGFTILPRFGTGAAPANGAALTGTALVAAVAATMSAGGTQLIPWSVQNIATGLTVGTQYWFDTGLRADSGGTATIFAVACIVVEF